MGDETKDERAQEQTGYTMTPTLEEATSSTKANGGEQVPVGKLLQAGLRGTRDDYEYSLHTFYKSPCFRQALLWGIGLGSAIALHRYKESRNIVRAADAFMASWAGVSLGGWLFCRQGELKQLSAVQDWQRERLTGVDIASVSDGSPKPLPTEPVDDQRR